MQPRIWGEKPYYSFDYYLKNTFGEKIYKIALDANLTCPTRDGKIDTRGCIFCSAGGSGEMATKPCGSIASQIEKGVKALEGKSIGKKYIAYFQSFTNTYGDIDYLKDIFMQALQYPSVVGISIATRPDCLPNEVLELLAYLKNEFSDKFIWIELGLQTSHEGSANYIRRGYPLSAFDDAVTALNKIGIPIIVHTILGLPHESREDMLATISYLNTKDIMGIKLQLLHVLKHTDLAIDYNNNEFKCLEQDEYISILIDCIEALSPDIVIHRLTGDGLRDMLIAPLWSLNKWDILNSIHRTLKLRDAWQGKNYHK